MKKTNLAWLFAAGLLATQIPSLTFDIKPAKANTTFRCDPLENDRTGARWATNVIFSNGTVGNKPLFTWGSYEYADSGYTPEERCYKVTSKLNRAINYSAMSGGGGYFSNLWLTTGRVNRLPVICYVRARDEGCNQENILVTLSGGNTSNPSHVLAQLVNYSLTGSGSPIRENEGDYYVNVGDLVENIRANTTTQSPPNPSNSSDGVENTQSPSGLPPTPVEGGGNSGNRSF